MGGKLGGSMFIYNALEFSTLDEAYIYLNQIRPRPGYLGGRLFAAAWEREGHPLNEIIKNVQKVSATGNNETRAQVAKRIRELDEQGNEMVKGFNCFMWLITKIKHLFGLLFFNRTMAIEELEKRTNLLSNITSNHLQDTPESRRMDRHDGIVARIDRLKVGGKKIGTLENPIHFFPPQSDVTELVNKRWQEQIALKKLPLRDQPLPRVAASSSQSDDKITYWKNGQQVEPFSPTQ